MEIDRGQDGGGKQEHDAFAAPAHLDLFLLAWWMAGGDGNVHESSRHQKINQRGDEQQALIPQMTPAARITGFDLRRWVNSSAITTRYAMKNTSSAIWQTFVRVGSCAMDPSVAAWITVGAVNNPASTRMVVVKNRTGIRFAR